MRNHEVKSPLALLTIALLSLGATACGGAGNGAGSASSSASSAASGDSSGTRPASTTTPAGNYLRGDDDVDEDGHSHYDDYRIRGYGRKASPTDMRVVTALVKRYYTAAAAGNGAMACSLIYASLAKDPSLTKTVPEDYGQAPRSPALRGKSCAQVTSLLFKQNHQQLTADVATLEVTSVRVHGPHGLALLAFRTTPERWIPMERDGGAWKIDALLDKELP